MIFVYTTVVNICEQPEGIKIASIFIVSIVVTSLVSRVMRSTELRVHGVDADDRAQPFLKEAAAQPIRIIANRPDAGDVGEYEHKLREARDSHHLPMDERLLFIEVRPGRRVGLQRPAGGRRASKSAATACCARTSPAIPNAIAALLLHIRDRDRQDPACLFRLDGGQPDRVPLEVPRVWRGGHGAGDPRSAAPVGARSAPASPDSRGMT